ncbi:Nitrogen permease regulator 3, partial [Coemansia sp. Benny D115]
MHDGNAILGIFLATYSSNGDYLPLRYPMSSEDYEAAEKLLKGGGAQKRAQNEDQQPANNSDDEHSATEAKEKPSRTASMVSGGTSNSNNNNSNSNCDVQGASGQATAPRPTSDGDAGRSAQLAAMQQAMDSFEPKFLAQLFSPRPSMSDRRFQVSIDQVMFIGHPLRDDPKERAREADGLDGDHEADAVSRLASITEIEGWKVKSDTLMQRGGNKLLADLGLMNLMLNREQSEAADSQISDAERAVRDNREWKSRGPRRRIYPNLFHVVLMLDNTAPGIDQLANRIYEHVLKRLTKALMTEQTESNYVLAQSRVMRSLNDTSAGARGRYVHELMECSELAANLIELFHGLRRGALVTLHVHRRIMLSLQIPRGPRLERPVPEPRHSRLPFFGNHGLATYADMAGSAATSAAHTPLRPATPVVPGDDVGVSHAGTTQTLAPEVQEQWGLLRFGPGDIEAAARTTGVNGMATSTVGQAAHGVVVSGRELQAGEHERYPRIEPYHALLLLEDAETLRRRLQETDASPTLLAVVEKALPTCSLAVLHRMVDCSFAQLCRFAAHLVYWNVARLVCPVRLNSVYVPTATPSAAVTERFAQRNFGLCALPRLLALLHPPRPAAQPQQQQPQQPQGMMSPATQPVAFSANISQQLIQHVLNAVRLKLNIDIRQVLTMLSPDAFEAQ